MSGAAGTRHPRSAPRNEVQGFVACMTHRSELSRREPRSSLVKLSGSQDPGGAHPTKVGTGARSAQGVSTRESHGWQKLIERILRLDHRHVARRGGDAGG